MPKQVPLDEVDVDLSGPGPSELFSQACDDKESPIYAPLRRMPKPVSPYDICDAWISYTNSIPHFQASAITKSTAYRFIWRSWCRFLANRQSGADSGPYMASPLEATALDVVDFLAYGLKSTKPLRQVSEVTRRRYFSVMQRIYAFCEAQEWIKNSPVRDISQGDTPKPEVHVGRAMTGAQWDACIKHMPTSPRDRAILMLLFTLGLRPEEVRKLSIHDLEFGLDEIAWIKIRGGNGPAQERRLPLPDAVASALVRWVDLRKGLPIVLRHEALLQADASNEVLRDQCKSMFVSRKSMSLSMLSLLNLSRDHISNACALEKLEPPSRVGPQIIRNTRLVRWLMQGQTVELVVAKAGLKNAKGLLHLAHACSEEIRARITPSMRRDDDPSPVISYSKKLA